ncbi:MAG TPA: disulfide bond formation protein B, partial [Caulobacteraceae bacterium]|nr:disulfide bond formation protein B [Caulobacteraceae bacterium]
MKVLDLLTRFWPLVALVVSAAMLAAAHWFEGQGYAPCTLCLRQREVYWAAIVIAALAIVLASRGPGARLAWVFDILLALTFLFGAAVAFYHSGVEWKWWPGPATCATTGAGANAADLEALLRGAEVKPPACDEPNWWFPHLGGVKALTMANWNTLISLGLT